MNNYEKFFSLFAIVFLTGTGILVAAVPETRVIGTLLPLALVGIIVNAALLFIVFKDILSRSFKNPASKLVWGLLVFLFFPTVLIYLPLYGFKSRNSGPEAGYP